MTGAALAARAKELAREAGFDLAGVARADAPPDLAFFAEWVGRGYAGEMAYLPYLISMASETGLNSFTSMAMGHFVAMAAGHLEREDVKSSMT